MSGTSGSGKNTYIKKHYPNAQVVSADDYFEVDGRYTFNHSKLGKAHAECLKKYIKLLSVPPSYGDIVVVNNTNTSALEIAPYVSIAAAFEVTVELITLLKDPKICAERNVHNVPLASVEKMAAAIKNRQLPKMWKFTSIKEITND